jgi:hypothetical protein
MGSFRPSGTLKMGSFALAPPPQNGFVPALSRDFPQGLLCESPPEYLILKAFAPIRSRPGTGFGNRPLDGSNPMIQGGDSINEDGFVLA